MDIDLETSNLRALINDLRPSSVDDLGLRPAIEALLNRRRAAGLEIVDALSLPGQSAALDPEVETVVYRVLQEALTNIAKHARASTVHIDLHVDEQAVTLEVRDDGVGFDTKAGMSGYGLTGMRERAHLAGGRVELRSGSDGTVVQARLPVRSPTTNASAPTDRAF